MTDETPLTLEVARGLLARGWSPLPLPPRAKSEPPKGYTGYAGRFATAADVERWTWGGNIAIRLPDDVVGVDVDVYKGGRQGLDDLMDRYGVLPATAWSTSREDGSGIGLFRVPSRTTLATDPAQGVDMIQSHHRYMVVWPSMHPEGRLYQWIDEYGGYLDGPPDIDELPELPWGWIEGLAVTKSTAYAAATTQEVRDFIAQHAAGTAPGALKGVRTRLHSFTGARHDTLVEVACWALREAAAGLYSADEAIAELDAWWRRVMDDPQRRDGGEFNAVMRWAVAQVLNEPERVAEIAQQARERTTAATTPPPPANVDVTTGEVVQAPATSWRNLPDEFWNARPALTHIRDAAHARARSADAVLVCTLARIAALTHPSVKLPAIVGGHASLNFLGAIVATSGAGKSSANAVARELVPIERKDVVADIPLGSGEGMTERFFELAEETTDDGKKRKVKKQVKTGALFYLDEGQALAEMGNRQGATLMPTLRAAWSGETIGQTNASIDTHRVLRDHKYRMAIIVGFQVNYAADMLADAEGGTPQRFVFASAVDPSVPFDPPPWPGKLHYEAPPGITAGDGRILSVDPDIADGLRRRQVLIQRGEYVPDPLDSHAELGRLKVAALLALMDERYDIDQEDWALAGQIMRTSAAVRSWVIEEARQKARQVEEARIASAVRREAAMEDSASRRALLAGAKAVARRVHRGGGELVTVRDIHHAVNSKYRSVVALEDMTEHAIASGWIVADGAGWRPGASQPV